MQPENAEINHFKCLSSVCHMRALRNTVIKLISKCTETDVL